jgi:hypothetical protein
MTPDLQRLLAIRDQRRAAAPNELVDTIVVDRLKNQMVSTLRQAIDELSRIDCRQRPALAAHRVLVPARRSAGCR